MPPLRSFLSALCVLFCLLGASAQNSSPAALPDGITLPSKGSVYAVDRKGDHATLIQLHATETTSNSHAASNFARGMVYSGPRASVELKGLKAGTELSSDQAFFLVRINTDDPELARNMVHLIRLQQAKSNRVVSTFSQNVFGGGRQKKYDDVPVAKSDVAADVWLKLTPEKPLAPGEYGIAFIPKDPNLTGGVVYDFNVALDSAKPEKR